MLKRLEGNQLNKKRNVEAETLPKKSIE